MIAFLGSTKRDPLTGCTKKLDPDKLDFLGEETRKIETEYISCSRGKRDSTGLS